MMRPIAAILFVCLLPLPSLLAEQEPTLRGRSVARWSGDLSHPHVSVRVEAAKVLGRLGPHAGAAVAVDPLIAALRDRNPDVRMHAATALGRLKSEPAKCLAALTKLAADKDQHARFAAEWSIARLARDIAARQHTQKDTQTLEALLADAAAAFKHSAQNSKHLQQIAAARQLLSNPNPPSDRPVGEGLSTAQPEAALVEPAPPTRDQLSASDELDRLAANLRGNNRIVQLKAIAALVRLERADKLIAAWRDTNQDAFLQWQLTQAVAAIGQPAVPLVSSTLRDEVEPVGLQAAACLRQMGPVGLGSLPVLQAVIEDPTASNELRSAAISAVASFGPAAEDAVPTLAAQLDDNAPEVLVEASLEALAALGPAAGATSPRLLEILRADDQSTDVRGAAAEALATIDPTSREVAAVLIALIGKQDDLQFAIRLAGALGHFGEAGAPALPRLIELLDATSDFERQEIIQTIGNIGPKARPATARLIACLTDRNEADGVQAAAAKALGNLGDEAVIALAQQLKHADASVRQNVARGLVEIGTRATPVVKPLELRLLDGNEDLQIRALATVALGQIGSPAGSTLPTLTRILGDVRQAVYLRAMAAVAVGQIDPGQAPRLVAALQDAEPEIRVAAAYALQRLPAPHPDALPSLLEELENDWGRSLAMRALSEFPDESRDALADRARDVTREDEVRMACIALLGQHGLQATQPLLQALNDGLLAESAYWSLRDLGNQSLPALLAATDNEADYNPAALAAIEALVTELSEGIGGGADEHAWTGGHRLMEDLGSRSPAAARMATAAPEMIERTEQPASSPATEPSPPSDARSVAALPPPQTGYKSVKVFYGTNRDESLDENSHRRGLPWYAWTLIVTALGGIVVFLFRQVRRRETGKTIVGVAGIILLSLAVESLVHFNQMNQAGNRGTSYGVEYSTEVKLGVCEVTIPDVHQAGEVERPSILRLQIAEDPEQHIVVKQVQQLDPDAFFTDLRGHLDERGNSILVFVHGYNVSFDSAARRTAQMSHDLKFAGAPLFYSWPSQGNWRKYRTDEKNVELSINQLKGFLADIVQRSGADTINLIAHSMGNRALTKALKEIEVASSRRDKLFNQVILAAPDIDADIFRERIAPAIVDKARQITLYASSKDLALAASREFNNGNPRAGDAGPDLVLVPGIDTIDVSAGETSLLGHSYYGDNTSVLHDIKLLLRDQPAAERELLEPYPRFEPTHWLFQPAAVARRQTDDKVWR